jgi:esterase FrsA
MTQLNEAKQFVGLHARHMGLPRQLTARVLERIHALDGERPGCWVVEWWNEAEVQAALGDPRMAAKLYNLARFPVADDEWKQAAGAEAARIFRVWLEESNGGERLIARVAGTDVPFLFRRGPRADAPLVVLMGGIVSLKEQWGEFLALGARLGCAIAIADFPGVGENCLAFTRGAAALFGAILDRVGGLSDASRTLVVAPSFGGYLAMLHSLHDRRIQGVVTVGAPIRHFFADANASVPAITRAALEHVTGLPSQELRAQLVKLALSQEEIAALSVPVLYVASLRDEIIPQRDWREAAAINDKLRIYAFDDVHGSPHHLRQTRLLILSALCAHAGRARLARWLTRLGRFAFRLSPVTTRPSFA